MRRRQTRGEQKQLTRDRLLRAAARVVARRGFHAASVNEVAREAGYSFGAVYSNFESKESLLLAVLEDSVARQVRDYARPLADGASAAEQITAGAERWMRLLREDPDYFPLFVEFWLQATRDRAARQRFLTRYGALREAVSGMVRTGAHARGIELEAEATDRLATVVLALGNGVALEKLVRGDEVPDELLGWSLGVLLDALAAPAAKASG